MGDIMVKKLLDLDKTKTSNVFNEQDDLIKAISNRDIAIIGIACEFPKASNIDEFWDVLRNGVNCRSEFSGQRKQDTDDYLMSQGKSPDEIRYSKYAHLKEIDKFDYDFFRISPKEAQLMDPKQRMFLETAWKAIEDSGYGGKKLAGTRTGVYLGYSVEFDYEYKQFIEAVDPSQRYLSIPGNIKAIVASRISYILNLRGPSMLIDTTCSSSLVATHLACQAIRNEECEMALSGAIKIRYLPEEPKDGVNIGISSPQGITRTFDDSSDGPGSGEGVAAVLLKPLSKAVEDGDHIYAIIKGTAINQDGTSNGISAPNPAAQEDVIVRAWKDGKIDPNTIFYIEAHGTGTKLGDPIEIEGITKAFSNYTQKKQFCAVGSVKANLGHLDDAAGIAGLIKAVLILNKKEIPPLLNFYRPNHNIDFANSPVYINDRIVKVPSEDAKIRCGVSSFGISGTNCHMVLEEAPKIKENFSKMSEQVNVLTISAKSKESLKQLVQLYKDFFRKNSDKDLNNICYTANTGREHSKYRLAIVVAKGESIKEKLDLINLYRIDTNKSQGVFYGEYQIASLLDKSRHKNEISENQRSELSDMANKSMDKFINDSQKNIELMYYICEKYIQGANVEWDRLYKSGSSRRVRIPTYPFLKNRCWLEVKNKNNRSTDVALNSFYTTKWVEKKLISDKKDNKFDVVLVLKGNENFGSTIAGELRQNGTSVFEASIGDCSIKKAEYEFLVENNENSYTNLLNDLIEDKKSIQIIHTLTMYSSRKIENISQLADSQEQGVKSLFYIVKAILNCKIELDVEIVLLSEYVNDVVEDQEIITPENATLLGLGKVIGQEYSNIKCRFLDIDENTSINKVVNEISGDFKEYLTTYRNGKRYIEEYISVKFDSVKSRGINVREGGVYLVSGGLGGIGLEICKYFASCEKVKLILLNRSKLPERGEWETILTENSDAKLCYKIRSITEIEKSGSQVDYYSIDISDFEKMEVLMKKIKASYNQINGIVHSAGVAGDGFILNKDEKTFTEVLLPKVHGTWNLGYFTQNENLDFFVMFSSLASILGGPGQGDYVAANSYLDSFQAYRNKNGKSAVTINWPAWKEVGMAVDYGLDVDNDSKALQTEQAIDIFHKAIHNQVNRIIVVNALDSKDGKQRESINLANEINAKIINAESGYDYDDSNSNEYQNAKILGRDDGIYSDTEIKMAKVWAYVLGLKEISIYSSFFELGGDSLIAIHLKLHIKKIFNKDITLQSLIQNPTITELAKIIDKDNMQIDDKYEEYEF